MIKQTCIEQFKLCIIPQLPNRLLRFSRS